jgi:hypothetical protein
MKRIALWLPLSLLVLMPVLSSCGPVSDQDLNIALDIEDEGRYDELFALFQRKPAFEITPTMAKTSAN